MSSIRNRKCRCGGIRFYAHQLARHDVVVDEEGNYMNDHGVYDAEKPYGPFICALCGAAYDELEELDEKLANETKEWL